MTRDIRYTNRAVAEIAALDVSDAYFAAIEATIKLAADIPTTGTRVAHRPDVYRRRSGSHWIYYRDQGTELVVLRLTHTRRMREHL